MKRVIPFILAAGLALGLLTSCEFIYGLLGIDGEGGGIAISGTITVDPGVSTPPSTARILVGIISYLPSMSQSMTSLSPVWDTKIADNPTYKPFGLAVPYDFEDVDPDEYMILAWVDLNGNGSWETGEASGTFPAWTGSTPPPLRDFQSDYSSANIVLYPSGGGGGATKVTISGTITTATGVTIPTGSTVIVGLMDVLPVGDAATWSTAVSPNPKELSFPSGGSLAYSFSDVPVDEYMVVAWVDLDSDDTWDEDEASGTYPEWADPPALQSFTASVANANIALWLNPLSVPATPLPADAATMISTSIAKLDWSDSTTSAGATVTYDIYAGEGAVPTTKSNTAGPLTTSEWTIPAAFLAPNKTYKWQVVARDSNLNTRTGPVWTFTTGATASSVSTPANPLPANNATGVDPMITKLDWDNCTSTAAGATVTYDVYIGSPDLPPNPNGTSLAASEYQLMAAFLEHGKTYKWKVVAKDTAGNQSQAEWSFTTGAALPPSKLTNSYFMDTGWSDWTGSYSTAADWTIYGNMPTTGDYLPGWTFAVDTAYLYQGPVVFSVLAPGSAGADAGALDNHVRLASDLDQDNSNGYAAYMRQDMSYTVTATSKLKIRFKLAMYRGGGAYAPYYEAPLKIDLSWGAGGHTIKAYTDVAGAAAPAETVSSGQWLEREFALAGLLAADGQNLAVGTTITRITVWSNGWSWDAYVDTVAIYE